MTPFSAMRHIAPVLERVRQAVRKLMPVTPAAAQPGAAVPLDVARKTATLALLNSKIPEWRDQEGEDWFARNYYRLYLAFCAETPTEGELRKLLADAARGRFNEGNRALVQAYDSLITCLHQPSMAPIASKMDELRQAGAARVNKVFALIMPLGLLVSFLLGRWLWRLDFLNDGLKVFICLVGLPGLFAAACYGLWRKRAAFNPNNKAIAALADKFQELRTTSFKTIQDHAREPASEFNYAVMSGKDWVFSRTMNKWASEKYVFWGDAQHEATCIEALIRVFSLNAVNRAQNLPLLPQPTPSQAYLVSPERARPALSCRRCRQSVEALDNYCMACGFKLVTASEPAASESSQRPDSAG